MRIIVARTIVVLWVIVVITAIVNLERLSDWRGFQEAAFIVGLCAAPVWALQFILTGYINPLALLRRALSTPPQ